MRPNTTIALTHPLALPLALALTAAFAGCGRGGSPARDAAAPDARHESTANSALLPALTRLVGAGGVDGEHLTDVETCGGCHADVLAQQQVSAHAMSSLSNPIYRFGIDRFRSAVSNEASQMCGGCHDIPLLIDGAMRAEVAPSDNRAHAGVTCRVCHGVTAASNDGNGSYSLSRRALVLPDAGDNIAAHKQAAAPIDSEQLCGSCHRSFLSTETGNAHFLAGMDDLTSWKSSAYNSSGLGRIDDPIAPKSCVDCHMPLQDAPLGDVAADASGRVRSHRFLGGHTWLASMLGDDTQLAMQRQMLRGSVTLDIAAVHDGSGSWSLPADAAPLPADGRLWVDLVARNVAVGHSFPAGVRDAVDSWLEIEVVDAHGTKLAATADDEQAHRFRALVGDRNGRPQLIRNTHAFHQLIVDHTIPPRDARVVRYSLALPAYLPASRLPLRIQARLLHRSRNRQLQRAVCDESRGERARAFGSHRRQHGKVPLDPCAPQPITEIASAVTWLGTGAEARLAGVRRRPDWKRLYEHALGLSAELPKEAVAARASLLAALEGAEASSNGTDAAKIYAALANVYAAAPCGPSAPAGWPNCQGRLDEGLRWLQAADALVPDHPAVARIRAKLYQQGLRWPEAAVWLTRAVERAPQNVSAVRDLAVLLSTLGQKRRALAFASDGLSMLPRDDGLLRVQALALEALGRADPVVRAAKRAYQTHRRVERPTEVRARCAANDASCSLERLQVHTHPVPLESVALTQRAAIGIDLEHASLPVLQHGASALQDVADLLTHSTSRRPL